MHTDNYKVHYHIIPAPELSSSSPVAASPQKDLPLHEMHKFEIEARDILDEDEATGFISRVKAHL